MKLVLISAGLALMVLGAQANAEESRACPTPSIQNFSTVCIDKPAQKFSRKEKGINYCPIPKKAEIPTS